MPSTDDLADALAAVCLALPFVMRALSDWARTSGLHVKPSTCIMLPLRKGNCTALRTFLDTIHAFSPAAVRSFAHYLGVDLGMNGAAQWATLCPKVARRGLDVGSADAPVPTRIALHNVHVTRMLCYRAAFPRTRCCCNFTSTARKSS